MIEKHIDFLKWQIAEYNKIVKPANGFVCKACKNRRYFAFIDQAGNFALKACTCQNVIAAKQAEEKEQKGRKKNVQ